MKMPVPDGWDTPIGEQPDQITINPSQAYPWYGWKRAGERFTEYQMAALVGMGIDPLMVEAITVKRQPSDREMWWGVGTIAPVFAFQCPVLARRKDGKVKVIARDGANKFVFADGWVHLPRTYLKRGFY